MYVSEQKYEKVFRVKFYSMKVGCDGYAQYMRMFKLSDFERRNFPLKPR